jgi:hypothetical protein
MIDELSYPTGLSQLQAATPESSGSKPQSSAGFVSSFMDFSRRMFPSIFQKK